MTSRHVIKRYKKLPLCRTLWLPGLNKVHLGSPLGDAVAWITKKLILKFFNFEKNGFEKWKWKKVEIDRELRLNGSKRGVTHKVFPYKTADISVIFYKKFPLRIDLALSVPQFCSFLYKVPADSMSVYFFLNRYFLQKYLALQGEIPCVWPHS